MAKHYPLVLYTDGACSGNPGPGGYGVVLTCEALGVKKELSEGFRKTTNNRMELLAVIVGLEAIRWENADVKVVSDSSYVVNAVTKGWLFGWEKKPDFAKKANPDLWSRFLKIYRKHNVTFEWVKGHAGHPMNERCDRLAVEAYGSTGLKADEEFEKTLTPNIQLL